MDKLYELLKTAGYEDAIEIVLDFDPYQASILTAHPSILTFQFTHFGIIADKIQKGLGGAGGGLFINPYESAHAIISFIKEWEYFSSKLDEFIKSYDSLEEGTYIWNGHSFIQDNTDKNTAK